MDAYRQAGRISRSGGNPRVESGEWYYDDNGDSHFYTDAETKGRWVNPRDGSLMMQSANRRKCKRRGSKQLRAYAVNDDMSKDEFMYQSFLGTFIEVATGQYGVKDLDVYKLAQFCNGNFSPAKFNERFYENGYDLDWACGYLGHFGCLAVPYHGSYGVGGYASEGLLVAGQKELEREYRGDKDARSKAISVLRAEAEEYNRWAEGDTYYAAVTDDGTLDDDGYTRVEFLPYGQKPPGRIVSMTGMYVGEDAVKGAAWEELAAAREDRAYRIGQEQRVPLEDRRYTVTKKNVGLGDGRYYGSKGRDLTSMRVGETWTEGDESLTRSASRRRGQRWLPISRPIGRPCSARRTTTSLKRDG